MLVECGFVKVTANDGAEYRFTPSFSRIATLGHPKEIVALYAGLHGPKCIQEATYVLACLCDQPDPYPLIGWMDENGWQKGMMSDSEKVIIARHLMRHGIIGKAKPNKSNTGKYSESFDASEFIAAACVHLGLSREDAENISMTEFHKMFEMKFPELKEKEVPSRDDYKAFMAKIADKKKD